MDTSIPDLQVIADDVTYRTVRQVQNSNGSSRLKALDDGPQSRAPKKPRGGLSAAELTPETLYAGEPIMYNTMGMGLGDPRGKRTARVLAINGDEDYPLTLDTEELITQTQFVKRLADRKGNKFGDAVVKWRKLHTLTIVDGAVDGVTRSRILNQSLRVAVAASFAATREELHIASARAGSRAPESALVPEATTQAQPTDENDPSFSVVTAMDAETCPTIRTDQSERVVSARSDCSSSGDEVAVGVDTGSHSPGSSIANIRGVDLEVGDTGSSDQAGHVASAGLADEVVSDSQQSHDSEGDQSDQCEDSEEEPNPKEAATVYHLLKDIPTNAERAHIRHQKNPRRVAHHVPKSRLKRYKMKRAAVRNSTGVYHAKTAEAIYVTQYLKKPGVAKRLKELHRARPVYEPPAPSDDSRIYSEVVPWPSDVSYIQRSRVPKGIRFASVGNLGKCECVGDCFKDVCLNSATAIYCTPKTCNLNGRCSNAPCDRSTLRLFRTRTSGLGVFTTAPMWTGDIVGEYVGQLLAFEGKVDGVPPKAWKYNSGYTLLYNKLSTKKKFIYVEAASCGSITRFINHSCHPNADFVEMSNGTNHKVLVVMNRPVTPSMEITVNYGNDKGFKCHCDECE